MFKDFDLFDAKALCKRTEEFEKHWQELRNKFLAVSSPLDRLSEPYVQIEDKGSELLVSVVGVKGVLTAEENLELHVLENNKLQIKGTVVSEQGDKTETFYRSEKYIATFEKLVALPCAVSAEVASAKMEEGILKIALPKINTLQAVRINIE